MRDEPTGTPLPKKFKPSDYHANTLKEVEKQLLEIRALSIKKADIRAEEEYQVSLNDITKYIRKANKLREQYEKMLVKVKNWLPPTLDHQGLKDFMIEQITGSIKCDCDTSYYENQQVKVLSGREWKVEQIQKLQKDLAYHTKENLEEISRIAGRNDWVQKLRESLK